MKIKVDDKAFLRVAGILSGAGSDFDVTQDGIHLVINVPDKKVTKGQALLERKE